MRATRFSTIPLLLVAFVPCGQTRAQDAASARSFLDSAYSNYGAGERGVPLTSRYFHSSLLALIQADVRAADRTQQVPNTRDGDPLCDCQEWDGIWDRKIDITMQEPGRAEALVSFALFAPGNRTGDDWRTLKIVLVPERGAWRILDIFYIQPGSAKNTPVQSFRRQLQDDIKRLSGDAERASH